MGPRQPRKGRASPPDKAGDIALGFSEPSSMIHSSIACTGRVPTDKLGTMESISALFRGSGSQNSGLSRWGDYTSMAIDPGDDCTLWYANEYSSKQWQLQLERAARCIQVLGRNKLSGDSADDASAATRSAGKGKRRIGQFAASSTGTDAREGSNFSDDGGFDAWKMNHT